MSRKSIAPTGRRVRSASLTYRLKHRVADGPVDLPRASEDELVTAYYRDGNEEAREYLAVSVRPFAYQIADTFFFRRMPSYSLSDRDDLRSCAVVGALDAMRRYELHRKVPFRAWLRSRITGEILDGLRRLQEYPRVIAKNRREVKPLVVALANKLHRQPTEDEICAEYGESMRSIVRDPLFWSGVFNQCDASISEDGEDVSILDAIEDTRDYAINHAADTERIIRGVLQKADRDDLWIVIYGYYFYGLNNAKIARAEDCSISTIVNRHKEALRILRDGLSREEWDELLRA